MYAPAQPSRSEKPVGAALLVLGAWGAALPFIGPTFGYHMGRGAPWVWSESHATLHVAPGLAAVLGALLMISGRPRSVRSSGALLALLGGVWFVIAPSLHPLWAGQSMGGGMVHMQSVGSAALSAIGYHYGTGALIIGLAAWTLGTVAAAARADAPSVDRNGAKPPAAKARPSEALSER